MYTYAAISTYWIIHLMLIVFNIYLFLVFWKELSNWYPILYSKIKWKLSFYYIFMIVLLIVRLIAVIPMSIDFVTENDLIVPSYETLIWMISEILPAIIMMFSFINFGCSSNDDIETLDERISIFVPSRRGESLETYKDDEEQNEYIEDGVLKHIKILFGAKRLSKCFASNFSLSLLVILLCSSPLQIWQIS